MQLSEIQGAGRVDLRFDFEDLGSFFLFLFSSILS